MLGGGGRVIPLVVVKPFVLLGDFAYIPPTLLLALLPVICGGWGSDDIFYGFVSNTISI